MVRYGDYGVAMADVYAATELSALFARMNKPSQVRIGNNYSFENLRNSPAVVIGAFNNHWTLQMTSNLRFAFAEHEGTFTHRGAGSSGCCPGLGSQDSAFSLEPHEFKTMVDAVRTAEEALGEVHYGFSPKEEVSREFRRSLFVVRDVKKGEPFTSQNIRSIRPGHGLHTRHFSDVLGKTVARDIERGTPLSWDLIST